MNRRSLLLSAWPAVAATAARADGTHGPERAAPPEWVKLFSDHDARGTIVVTDARRSRALTLVHDAQRARQRFTPASTFKIPHSLFALDAGVLRDEFQQIPWDGVQRSVAAWNADQDLRSAVRNSTVWVFERFARQIGLAGETAYLERLHYGNAVATGHKPFWVDGDLAISAQEQIAFLRLLYRNELPFRVEHQRLVKDVIVNEAGRDWILRAKTGWSGQLGWWVGWVEWPSGPVFFAMNIDTPNRANDLAKRVDITRAILRSIDALPAA